MATHTHSPSSTAHPDESSPPTLGHVYGDARHESDTHTSDRTAEYEYTYEIVYIDADRLLLSETSSPEYRYERRDQFENGIGRRWKLVETRESDSNSAAGQSASQLLSLASHLRDQYRHDTAAKSDSKAAALTAFLEIADQHTDPTTIDWTRIDGIGQQTAANLREHGFETDADIHVAPDATILDVNGVGEKTLDNLYAYIE